MRKVFPYKFQKVRTSKEPQRLLHLAFDFTDERNAQRDRTKILSFLGLMTLEKQGKNPNEMKKDDVAAILKI